MEHLGIVSIMSPSYNFGSRLRSRVKRPRSPVCSFEMPQQEVDFGDLWDIPQKYLEMKMTYSFFPTWTLQVPRNMARGTQGMGCRRSKICPTLGGKLPGPGWWPSIPNISSISLIMCTGRKGPANILRRLGRTCHVRKQKQLIGIPSMDYDLIINWKFLK